MGDEQNEDTAQPYDPQLLQTVQRLQTQIEEAHVSLASLRRRVPFDVAAGYQASLNAAPMEAALEADPMETRVELPELVRGEQVQDTFEQALTSLTALNKVVACFGPYN